MTPEQARHAIEKVGVIPSVRVASAADARFVVDVVVAAGISVVEITLTTPGALDVIAELTGTSRDLVIGAGTVLDLAAARRAVAAGAHFVTSPGCDRRIVEFTGKKNVLALPGVLTPTDVLAAHNCGARLVKVFPCGQLGGPAYFQALQAPFPTVEFVAAGGVTLQTTPDFIRVGAVAVGVGTELLPRAAVLQRDRSWITELSHRFVHAVQAARVDVRDQEIFDRR